MLITGASMMGAVFALALASADAAIASPEAVASGMRITFTVGGSLIIAALAVAAARLLDKRPVTPGPGGQSGRDDAKLSSPPGALADGNM